MRRLFTSIVAILALVTAVGGSTFAVFSQERQILGSTISTARIDLDLRALRNKPFQVQGMIPGQWTPWARVEVYNSSLSTPVKVYFYVTNLSGAACSSLTLKVTTGHAGSDTDERAITVFEGNINNINGSGNRREVTGSGKIFNPTLPENTTAVVQQRAQLAPNASNALQNTTCSWDEVFLAETPTL